MSQQHYIEQMMVDFNILPGSIITTPMQENLNLPLEEELNVTRAQLAYVAQFPYRQLIGVIIYLNVCTRVDVSYHISYLAKFNNKPTFLACKALWRLAKYLYHTRKEKLHLGGNAEGPYQVIFSDSDWGGCQTTSKSRSACVIFLGNGPIAWFSKMQQVTALSTFESEFMAMVPSIQMSNYIRKILRSAHIPTLNFVYAVSHWSDNQAAITVGKDAANQKRTKHVRMKYAYVQEEIARGAVVQEYVPSADNCSDIGTKSTGPKVHAKHFPTVMGKSEIPRIEHTVVEKQDDCLLCPMCSGVFYSDK